MKTHSSSELMRSQVRFHSPRNISGASQYKTASPEDAKLILKDVIYILGVQSSSCTADAFSSAATMKISAGIKCKWRLFRSVWDLGASGALD